MKYRPEIDGLRALAVLPVILFHAGFSGFSGGYVGVDVFFVISGYLITSILLTDLAADRFSIVNFYERRARRILPALFFVMAACLPIAWLWLTPDDLQDFGESLIAVSSFSSNILFWFESGYFETESELKPLLHTWSLAVEEQYYILFPILLLVIWRIGLKWGLAVLGLIFLASLSAAHWAAWNRPSFNFFMLPTRGWELLIGVFAAFYLRYRTVPDSQVFNQVASLAGLAMIVVSVVAFDAATPFPSLYALVPTLGTGLLILSAVPGTLAHRLLSLKPLVGVGLISYSAYLWHQPLLAFARHRSLDEVPDIWLLILCGGALLIAWVSWRYVEKPFRDRTVTSRQMILAFALAGIVLFSAIGFHLMHSRGALYRFATTAADISTVTDQTCHIRSGRPDMARIERGEFCTLGTPEAVPDTFLIGDSHAGSISDQLGQALAAEGRGLRSFSGGYCAPAIGFSLERSGSACIEAMAAVIRAAASDPQVGTIVIYAQWSLYTTGERHDFPPQVGCLNGECAELPAGNADLFAQALVDTLGVLSESGKRIFVVTSTPEFRTFGTRSFYRQQLGLPVEIEVSAVEHRQRNAAATRLLSDIEASQIAVIDAAELFCTDETCRQFSPDGYPLFSDTNHVNALGAELIVERLIQAGLSAQ